MLEKLMPKSDEFFDAFDEQAAAAVEGTKLVAALLEDLSDIDAKVKAIKEVEHRADQVVHKAAGRLHTQFITPFDRADMYRLMSRIDDVLDMAEAAAVRIRIYEMTSAPDQAKALGHVLVRCATTLQRAVKALRTIKQPEQIIEECRHLLALENEADELLRQGLASLFKSGADPLTVIKWKEVYDFLEGATDRCKDVANIIEGVVLEHA
jgi:predicted phosphate transport protein (TIGR00153 family)